MDTKGALYNLILEKQEQANKLKNEIHILLNTYYSLSSKQEEIENGKKIYDEYMKSIYSHLREKD